MGDAVERTEHARGRRGDAATLAQTFEFATGVGATAIRDVLRSAPLVGADSIFGDRPGVEVVDESDDQSAAGGRRVLRGFSPAPGFAFDVELRERGGGVFTVSFSQPDRATPCPAGDAVWTDGRINTERAAAHCARPLIGPRLSLRRWLFFRVGHARVMRDATARADLAAR